MMGNEADRVALEAMFELHRLIPWGHEFRVGKRKCQIVEFNAGVGRSIPKIRMVDPDCQSLTPTGKPPGPNAYTEVRMMFDVMVEGGGIDHVEISVTRTGFGGFVGAE